MGKQTQPLFTQGKARTDRDPTIEPMDTDGTENETPRPTGPPSKSSTSPATGTANEPIGPSILAILSTQKDSAAHQATPHRLPNLNGKRPPAADLFQPKVNKVLKTLPKVASSWKEALATAQDYLVWAYSMASSEQEKKGTLNLVEHLRDVVERGIIPTRPQRIEAAQNQPTQRPTAAQGGHPKATWAQTTGGNANQDKVIDLTQKPTRNQYPIRPMKETRRLILTNPKDIGPAFSSMAARNQLNQAFLEKGTKGPVVAGVALTRGNNIAITTTENYTAKFLLEKKDIWKHIINSDNMELENKWFKVAIHGIPTIDFNVPEGMEMIKSEIATFNRGLAPVGTPFWLTNAEKRANQRGGSIVVAFATQEEAERAIRERLIIAGISVRVEKLHNTAPTTQCERCQGYGHIQDHCRRPEACRLCGENHHTKQHRCNPCQSNGKACIHLSAKCKNCAGPHQANAEECETILSIKGRGQKLTTQDAIIHRTLLYT